MKNKKGWTEILEVFISILLLAGVITIALNSGGFIKDKNKSEIIYKEQVLILKIIQLDDDLRSDILNAKKDVESDNSTDFPSSVNASLENSTPNYLECKAKICTLVDPCNLNNPPEKNEIFVKSVLITASNTKYDSRELRLFCWER